MKTKLISIILSLVLTSNLFAISYPATSGYYGNRHFILNTSYSPNGWQTGSTQPCSSAVTSEAFYDSIGSLWIQENHGPVSSGSSDCWEYQVYLSPDSSCPSGQIYDTSGTCTTCPSPNVVDGYTGLCTTASAVCSASGGILQSDGTCLNKSIAVHNLFASPTSKISAGVFLGGLFLTALGAIPSPFTPAFLSIGINAIGLGGTTALVTAASDPLNPSYSGTGQTPSNDLTIGDNRVKINLDTYTGNQEVTQTSVSTNKVTEATVIPQTVSQNLANATPTLTSDVVNNTPLAPVNLTGTTDTTYDYTNNTATTKTVNPDQTITTTTTPIVVTNNPDGSTTAAPSTSNSSVPVVNSGGGGQVVNKTPGTAQLGGGVQGGASLDDIYNQLHMGGDPAGTLQGTPDNGLDKANSLMGDVQNSFTSFQMVDPLGLSAVAPPIDTISLDLYGHHFVVFDQNTLNQLPIAMIRSLLLFIAALIGLQNVLTGGM